MEKAIYSGICTSSIDSGYAIVEFQRTQQSESSKYLAFNPGSAFNAPMFACYDGENNVFLFRKDRYTSTEITFAQPSTDKNASSVYVLHGRTYATMVGLSPGIYVMNGKKMVIK